MVPNPKIAQHPKKAMQKSTPSPFEWKNDSSQPHYSTEKLVTSGFGHHFEPQLLTQENLLVHVRLWIRVRITVKSKG